MASMTASSSGLRLSDDEGRGDFEAELLDLDIVASFLRLVTAEQTVSQSVSLCKQALYVCV